MQISPVMALYSPTTVGVGVRKLESLDYLMAFFAIS